MAIGKTLPTLYLPLGQGWKREELFVVAAVFVVVAFGLGSFVGASFGSSSVGSLDFVTFVAAY